jgi:hypothetical protein
MERDALRMREGGPFVFAQVQDQTMHIFSILPFSHDFMLVPRNRVCMFKDILLSLKPVMMASLYKLLLLYAGETWSGRRGDCESDFAGVGNCDW